MIMHPFYYLCLYVCCLFVQPSVSLLCAQGQFVDVSFNRTSRTHNHQCLPCPLGHYCSSNTSFHQVPCPVKSFQNETGQSDCKICELNKNRTRLTECASPINATNADNRLHMGITCHTVFHYAFQVNGTFRNRISGRTNCGRCPAGYFRNLFAMIGDPSNNGLPACQICPLNHYCPTWHHNRRLSQGVKVACALGTHSNETGQTECQKRMCHRYKAGWIFKTDASKPFYVRALARCASARRRSWNPFRPRWEWKWFHCVGNYGRLSGPDPATDCPKLCSRAPEIVNGKFDVTYEGSLIFGEHEYRSHNGRAKVGSKAIARCAKGSFPRPQVILPVCRPDGKWKPPLIECKLNERNSFAICTKEIFLCFGLSALKLTGVASAVATGVDLGIDIIDVWTEQRFGQSASDWVAIEFGALFDKRRKRAIKSSLRRPNLVVRFKSPFLNQKDEIHRGKGEADLLAPVEAAARQEIIKAMRDSGTHRSDCGYVVQARHKPVLDFAKIASRASTVSMHLSRANALFNIYHILKDDSPSSLREFLAVSLQATLNVKELVQDTKTYQNIIKKAGTLNKLATAGTKIVRRIGMSRLPFGCLAEVALSAVCGHVKDKFDGLVEQAVRKIKGSGRRRRKRQSSVRVQAMRFLYAPIEAFLADNPEFAVWYTVQPPDCRGAFTALAVTDNGTVGTGFMPNTVDMLLTKNSSCEHLINATVYNVSDMYQSFITYTRLNAENKFAKTVKEAQQSIASFTKQDLKSAAAQFENENRKREKQYLESLKQVIGWTSIGVLSDRDDKNHTMTGLILIVFEAGAVLQPSPPETGTIWISSNETSNGNISMQVQVLLHEDCKADLIWNAAKPESAVEDQPVQAPLLLKQQLDEHDVSKNQYKALHNLDNYRLWYIVNSIADDQEPPVYMIKLNEICSLLEPADY